MAIKRTVIVTGASQGIGAAVVQAFLDRGYNVVGNSRSFARNSRSGAIIKGVEAGEVTSVEVADAAAGTGAGSAARSRLFLLTIRGAMMSRSTLAEPQIGQFTSLRFSCCS